MHDMISFLYLSVYGIISDGIFSNSSLSICSLGTGHGVGAALNVHEGPQSISYRFGNMTPLMSGMVVSNEPGYYEDHAFGIRIEVIHPSRLHLLVWNALVT